MNRLPFELQKTAPISISGTLLETHILEIDAMNYTAEVAAGLRAPPPKNGITSACGVLSPGDPIEASSDVERPSPHTPTASHVAKGAKRGMG